MKTAALVKRWTGTAKSRRAFQRLLVSGEQFELYVTHCWGGGTESYVQNTVHGRDRCIILRNVDILGSQELFSLEVVGAESCIIIEKRDIPKLSRIASLVSVENLCGYKNLGFVLSSLRRFPCKIAFKLHDFYSVCPSITLTKNGAYCGDACSGSCVQSAGGRRYTASEWRELWRDFFARCDEFFFFSESARQIFTSFYAVEPARIRIKPHDMSYFRTKRIASLPEKLCIGVFGSASTDAKGRSVLKDFVAFSAGLGYRICMNGILRESDLADFSKNEDFACFGPYKPGEIYGRLVSQKIGVVFFPSICPETFSYVVSELMMTGIPVACFGIGAQAEKIRSYPLGAIIPSMSNEAILQTLASCHARGKEYYKVTTIHRGG